MNCYQVFIRNVFFFTASDCLALYQNGQTTTGVYSIHPKEGARTDVVCDMETMGGGWTVMFSMFFHLPTPFHFAGN